MTEAARSGVVTGGAGFLGSHVSDVLAEAGHRVTVVDLQENAAHRTVRADLGDPVALEAAFHGAEFVCHLGAVGDVYLAQERPALAAHVNVTGTANACEAALKSGVRLFVYASTWEVYGEPRYQPMDELHPCAPDNPYSITKLAGERIALSYGRLRERMRVVSLRLGTAYGSRMRPNSVFSVFIRQARDGGPVTVQGTGRQARQFTHARDIGRAFHLAIGSAHNGAIYNVVSDEVVTILDLASAITSLMPAQVAFAHARSADVPTARVSAARIAKDLAWRAQIPFAQGLRELVLGQREAAR